MCNEYIVRIKWDANRKPMIIGTPNDIVIRCKDCYWFDAETSTCCNTEEYEAEPYGFCAWGLRIEDAAKQEDGNA